MAIYLSNAFSLGMLDLSEQKSLNIRPVMPEQIPQEAVSVIGHPDTAKILSGILGFDVPFNRAGIKLNEGDVLYVAQYKGPRLPEGATVLPEGASFQFVEVCPA